MNTNWTRRLIGAVLCLSPLAILLASTIAAYFHRNNPPFAFVAFALLALAAATYNFYLSFIRLPLHRWLTPHEHAKNVSVVPVWGTLFVLCAAVFGFGSIGTALIALVAVLVDTGGTPWFLLVTWRDRSLWDA